ncbi:peptide ABC transporter substrate-binding protein [Trichococcus collinsii]|uniref:Oligopeptide transport system substrate-binding protein n=1 Tax=Trichococcus collinsii TaxID=157076 RepID=A0AB38A1F3_9LACT|nr:peptide ABC transporter substrate-binding protein [Trichococcus collinsii]CZQ95062.1 Hypothetical protein Tcol_1289 [Trichococcus collinsii]SEA65011.1 oligopeptide transport system substrate-binding protein [Trichococcus collinsii]
MRREKWLFSTTLAISLVLAGCSTGGAESADSEAASNANAKAEVEQVITVTNSGELGTLDNALAPDISSMVVIGNAIEGLYRIGADGALELGVASEEPSVSEDGLEYTFKIKEDANWSNGDPVTAEDFIYTYQKIVDANTGSPNVNKFYVLKNAQAINGGTLDKTELGVEAIDEKTVKFTLAYPTTYFKELLGMVAYLPQNHIVATELGSAYGTNSENTVYNGPFIVEGWEGTDLNWSFVPNEEYWDVENVQLDQINWEVTKDVATNVNLFESGDVQFTQIGNPHIEQYEGSDALVTEPKALVGYLWFNQDRTSTGNVHLRKALSQSFDKEAYVETVLNDGSVPLNGHVPSNYAYNPETKEDFRAENGDLSVSDIEAAQAEWELAKAELGIETLEIELLTSDADTSKTTSEFLQAEWQKNLPGLTVTIRNVPLKSRLEATANSEYDIAYGTSTPSYADPIAFLDMYESTNAMNSSNYANEEYDALLADTRGAYANDPEKRWGALLAAEKLLLTEDAAAAPIYQGANANLVDPSLKDVQIQPVGIPMYFRTAYVAE